MRRPSVVRALIVGALSASTGCLPYVVGESARTLPRSESAASAGYWLLPSIDSPPSTTTYHEEKPVLGMDLAFRSGLGDGLERSVRFPSLGGVIVGVKRQVRAVDDSSRTAVALEVGGGLINAGAYAEGEATLLVSAPEGRRVTPQLAARAMTFVGTRQRRLRARSAVGIAAGARVGDTRRGFAPELAIFRSHAAPGIRGRHVVVIPALTFYARSADILEILGRRQPRILREPRAAD